MCANIVLISPDKDVYSFCKNLYYRTDLCAFFNVFFLGSPRRTNVRQKRCSKIITTISIISSRYLITKFKCTLKGIIDS